MVYPRATVAHTPCTAMQASTALEQANQGLHHLGQTLRSLECFDQEDLRIWQEEVQRFEEVDKELLALQQHLPERQQAMAQLDKTFRLSDHFPAMMKQFASKDVELQSILDQKLRQKREGS